MDGDGQAAKRFLKDAHGKGVGQPDGPNHEGLYDAWAPSYNAELMEAGYVTPERCAAAVADLLTEKHYDLATAPVLDLGCGTGLSGLALRAAGFEIVDGVDLSEEMLAVAEKHGCYRRLAAVDLSQPLTGMDGVYVHAVAAGVISPGHAPEETISQALQILPSGGCLVFSLNDHALEARTYEALVNDVVDCGLAEVVFKEYGPHIPARDFNAMIYGLRKR